MRQEKLLYILIRKASKPFCLRWRFFSIALRIYHTSEFLLFFETGVLYFLSGFYAEAYPKRFTTQLIINIITPSFLKELLIKCKHNREPLKHFNGSPWENNISINWVSYLFASPIKWDLPCFWRKFMYPLLDIDIFICQSFCLLLKCYRRLFEKILEDESRLIIFIKNTDAGGKRISRKSVISMNAIIASVQVNKIL